MPKPQRALEKVTIVNTKTKLTAKINKSDWNPKTAGDWKLAKPGKGKAAPDPSPEPEQKPDGDADAGSDGEGAATKENWTEMAWPAARAYIKKITGVFPKSKAEAAELMED